MSSANERYQHIKVPAFVEVQRGQFRRVTREMVEMTANGPLLTIEGRTYRLGVRDEGDVRIPAWQSNDN